MAAPSVPAVTAGYTNFLQMKWNRVVIEVGMRAQDLWKPIANVDPDILSNPLQESQMSSIGQMRPKAEMGGFTYTSVIEGGTVTYRTGPWGLAFEWSREMKRFDLYGLFDDIASDLNRAAPEAVEVTFWALFNDSFTGSLYTGFDGLSLIHTAHPYINTLQGTFSNRSATDISLSVAGLQEMNLFTETMKDHQGYRDRRRLNLVLIHPARKYGAREVLQSEFIPYKADNTINSIVDDEIMYYCVPYLSSTSAWWGIATPSMDYKGHDIWLRWAIPLEPDHFEDKRVKSEVFTVYQNFGVGFGGCLGVWGSAGTGA